MCPNVYYLGHCGVVDIVDEAGKIVLSVGGLSGIYKPRDYLRGRFEHPPYTDGSMRSVYHVRNIDNLR